MLFLVVFGSLIAITVALSFFVSRGDRVRGRHERDPDTMWRETVREQRRDARAINGQMLNPDLRWTNWSRRNHPQR